MSDNLKAIGAAAGLSPAEQKQIDDFNKALKVHQELSNLPADVANAKYNKLTTNQQADLVKNFGNEDPTVKPNRGWLGTAWHYTGGALGHAIGYTGSHILAGLQNVSDVMTRGARTLQIAGDQGVPLFGKGNAWDIANDNGDKVFSPNRILDAKAKYGNDAVEVAMRIASKEDPTQIMASATDAQKQFLMLADPRNKVIPGIPADQVDAARANFQDTLDAVNAAKYSPGRFIANLVTPAQLEGSGLFYKAVSGAVDAAYRVLADPLLIAGKVKRLVDVSKYAVDVVVGSNKVDEVFAKPGVVNFWNDYGANLKALTEAEKSGDVNKIVEVKDRLTTLAPEFGTSVIKSFQKAEVPIQDAQTAKAFFLNAKQTDEMMNGAIGRQRVLIPTMNNARKLRIAAATTGNKVLNLDFIGPRFVDNYFFDGATDADGIAKAVTENGEAFVNKVTAATNFKGIARFSTAYIQHRIDRLKASLTYAPIFEKDVLDVTADDAPEKIYRLATTILPTKSARLFSEAFGATESVGAKKDMYYGLWKTIAEMRGLNTTLPGQTIVRQATGLTKSIHSVSSADDAFQEVGALPSDFSNFVSVPSLIDLDRAASRNGLVQKMIGFANSDFASRMTSAWSFLTLAGPRYAIRNATEDLMVNIAIGESPWGIIKSRQLSTRLNTALSGLQKAQETGDYVTNPLGAVMRIVNKKDVDKYAAEFRAISAETAMHKENLSKLLKDYKNATSSIQREVINAEISLVKQKITKDSVEQVRGVMAKALSEGKVNRLRASMGLKPMNKEESDILAEQIINGDIDNVLNTVSEGGMNFATGNDYITRTTNLARQMGVKVHALKIEMPANTNLVRKPGERGYKVQAVDDQDPASMVGYLMRVGYLSNDELGSIAVANLGKMDDASIIKKMTAWMNDTPEGQQFIKEARLRNNMDADQIARIAFNRVKETFVKKDDITINNELLDKIRSQDKSGEWKVSGSLSLDDLPTGTDLPRAFVGPTLIPAVEANQYTSALMTKGWTWLGQANARMSRQPMVIDEMIRIRKQFKKTGFEDKWIESYTRHVDQANPSKVLQATEQAKKDLAKVVEERAMAQVVSYVDNPLIRTQLAFSARNFARFYRATEDFYRRMYRIVKYNPEAIVKAALTYEGIAHSGWVQKDDQGQDYFVYPGIGPVYNAVQNTLEKLGIKQEFKVPFPVEFGAQLKMITPSLNPDSLVPTFSGPVAGISVTTLSTMLGFWDKGAADTIKGYALGKYAVDQPVLSALLPAHINRLYAAMNTDERNSQYASAWRKAVTYLEASGHGIPRKYNPDGSVIPPTTGELEAYRQRIKSTTQTILGLRFAFGFFAPASPQVQLKSDMAQWVSDNGIANYKQAFNKLLDKYPGNYDKAIQKWIELYPNEIPYTITESEKKSIAMVRYAQEAGDFVNNNKDLFKNYQLAAGFLIPHKTGFSWDAYKTMRDMGITQNKRVDDYLREVQTAADLQQYYSKKNDFEASLSSVGTTFEKTQLRKEFDAWKQVFLAGRPLVQEELSQGSQKAITRLKTLDELEAMLSANLNVRPKTENALRDMLKVYRDYQNEKANYDAFGGNQNLQKILKDETITKLRAMATFNENTQAAYDVLFGRLLGD